MCKYLPYEHSFNEELMAKELFSLSLPKVRSIVNYNIRNYSFVTVLSLVSRYLLHSEKLDAVTVRVLLRKYAVVISYMYLKSVKDLNFKYFESSELETILTNMVVSSLNRDIKDDGIFPNLFNDINYNKNLKALIKKVKLQAGEKISSAIYHLLRCEYNYFSKSTNVVSFIEYSDMKRFDMIVSEALLKKDFYSFSFSLDYEMFKENFTNDKPTNDQIRMSIIFVGYLIYDLFNKGNFKFKKEIDFILNKYFTLACLDKDAGINKMKLSFIKKKANNIEIDWNEFRKFDFTYNNIKATFDYKKIVYSII
jgi:hypothetical protein